MRLLKEFWDFLVSHQGELWQQIGEHLWLTLVALVLAALVGVSVGLLLSRLPKLARPVLAMVNIIQTIPSLALLGFLLPILGIGATPAIVALFLYALLPIVRNAYIGVMEVDPAVREAARGMGLSNIQRLTQVELPLALPVIFAGLRTAAVINVGVATLCALIAAGGLGEFIFRGISLNNSLMVLAGALPAALLAIAFDTLLGALQRLMARSYRLGIGVAVGMLLVPLVVLAWPSAKDDRLVAGFPSEFIERGDGYQGLRGHYPGLDLAVREMEIGLMYSAVKEGEVDVISGFSTDGRIEAYGLRSLEDDRAYFPPYHCAPLVRQETLNRYPEIEEVLSQLHDRISDEDMVQLNYRIDQQQESLENVAKSWMREQGWSSDVTRETGKPDIIIGSKNFTENLLLATLFGLMVENQTLLDVDLALGFGGTQLVYEALQAGEIDLYPEYTGTGLLVILKAEGAVRDSLGGGREATYAYVQQKVAPLGLKWLPPLGFNNTFALMMREDRASALGITKISDLVAE